LPATAREARDVLGLSLYAVEEKGLWIEMPLDRALAAVRDAPRGNMVGPSVRTTFAVGESPVCAFRRPDPGQEGNAALQVEIRGNGTRIRSIAVPPPAADAAGTVKIALPMGGLPPGDYTVTVQAAGQDGATDRGTVPLRVRAAVPARANGV
jgi:hypothetical protein